MLRASPAGLVTRAVPLRVESRFGLVATRAGVIRVPPAGVGGIDGLASRSVLFAGFAGSRSGGGSPDGSAGGGSVRGQRLICGQGSAASCAHWIGDTATAETVRGSPAGAPARRVTGPACPGAGRDAGRTPRVAERGARGRGRADSPDRSSSPTGRAATRSRTSMTS